MNRWQSNASIDAALDRTWEVSWLLPFRNEQLRAKKGHSILCIEMFPIYSRFYYLAHLSMKV
jgi:hypothetical protein